MEYLSFCLIIRFDNDIQNGGNYKYHIFIIAAVKALQVNVEAAKFVPSPKLGHLTQDFKVGFAHDILQESMNFQVV